MDAVGNVVIGDGGARVGEAVAVDAGGNVAVGDDGARVSETVGDDAVGVDAVGHDRARNKASGKSRLNTICRLKPLVIFSVKLWNSFKGKYYRHLTRVLVWFPETKGMSKFTVPHISRGENVVHSSVERM